MPKRKVSKIPTKPTTTGSTRRRTMGHDSAPGGTKMPAQPRARARARNKARRKGY